MIVMICVRLIEMKNRNIDTIPQNLRGEVLAKLNERGFDGYGEPLE